MYAFGYNNVALLVHSPLTAAAAVALGTYLGLGYSRWVMELAALRPRTTATVNITVALAALLGIIFSIPISFTLVAYSSMLAASYSQKMRVIKIEKFLKAYIGVLAALGASAIFPYLKPLLAPLA
jgi:phosphate/sulfate permease